MRSLKLIDKKLKKKVDGKCYFCPCNDYDLLDVHRIVEGKNGGKYNDWNTVCACTSCHRKIHAGKIKITGKFRSTAGSTVLIYEENGVEIIK